jgi:hypothetical protein
MEKESVDRMYLTDKNEYTVNSSVIEWFMWRNREDDDYSLGQLLVKFHNTGVYTYNVGYEAYDEMRKRAENPEEYEKTPFEVYDSRMIDWVSDEKRESDEGLYIDKLNL